MPQINIPFILRPNTFNNNDARRDEVMSDYLIQELIKEAILHVYYTDGFLCSKNTPFYGS